jgi:hypothetical protein
MGPQVIAELGFKVGVDASHMAKQSLESGGQNIEIMSGSGSLGDYINNNGSTYVVTILYLSIF